MELQYGICRTLKKTIAESRLWSLQCIWYEVGEKLFNRGDDVSHVIVMNTECISMPEAPANHPNYSI